jgi:putative heme-binding domain-containing protein
MPLYRLSLPAAIVLAFVALSPFLGPPSPCSAQENSAQEDPFAAGVRVTPWLSPADEQKAFKLPPGFEINLVAAEPDIQKPLNMAFDERGRIWLTCSVEYPYAAPLDKPARDSIRVLEDTDGDGRYEKMTVFADGLNIPIGIYPYKGGCIAWSIPNIWHFEDTDADGKCDKRTILYGPFDHTRDVHGNCNAFRRGFDGWIYACHGFNNDSHVKGKDGHEVHLNSGNTFRFKIDGSRIEHFTHGQVNPFGMCFDELFNIFTADCHSKPLTQLIRGGYYPSFGKPHDGLGFVPSMMEHLHGSTAICGVVKYSGENFPKEYRGNFLSGNVMTSRINQNKPEYHGSTIKAVEQPDFLSSTDPWFRPVDLQIGPDGALYVLDFYNRIIGHYEVPLPHPGRDRTSGRIWRVAYKGEGTRDGGRGTGASKPGEFDLTKMSIEELIAQLDSPQLEHRLRVQHWLGDKVGKASLPLLEKEWAKYERGNSGTDPHTIAAVAWLLHGFGELDTYYYNWLSVERKEPLLNIHALHMLPTALAFDEGQYSHAAQHGLRKDSALVRLVATRIQTEQPDPAQYFVLRDVLAKAAPDDALLRYGVKQALRANLSKWDATEAQDNFARTRQEHPQLLPEIVRIACQAKSEGATEFVLLSLELPDSVVNVTEVDFGSLAEFAGSEDMPRLLRISRAACGNSPDQQAAVLLVMQGGLARRSRNTEALQSWGSELAATMLQNVGREQIGWTAVPLEGKPTSESPWVIAPRPCADGQNDQPFYYSLPKGEQRTGIYRSGSFEIPAKLSFWIAGHSGFPTARLNDGNYVRLRDAATHAILAEARPPRNDTAQRIEWDLTKPIARDEEAPSPQPSPKGRGGYVELIDGDTADAYAWLAVGRFSLAALNPSDTARKQQLAAEIVGKLKLAELRPQLATLVAAPSTDGTARAALGLALVALDPDSRAAALVAALNDPAMPTELRTKMGAAIATDADETYLANLREVMQRAPSRLQTQVAETLAGDAAGAESLLALVEAGQASPRLLLAANVTSKLGTLQSAKLTERVAAATAKLPAVSETLDKLIAERRSAYTQAAPSLERGQTSFTKHCAACHQIAGQGAVVGPQLDGIGGRGLERIIEDVLDPNRNVDVAFRTTTMRLADGRVVTGLFRRAEGTQRIFADNQGKEFTVAADEIDEEQKTALSLMPANVPEIVPAEEFHDLVAFLLSQRNKPAEKK